MIDGFGNRHPNPSSSPSSSSSSPSPSAHPLISVLPVRHQLDAQLNLLAFLQARTSDILRLDLSQLSPTHQLTLLHHAQLALVHLETQRHLVYASEMKERLHTQTTTPTPTTAADAAPEWVRQRLKGFFLAAEEDQQPGAADLDECRMEDVSMGGKAVVGMRVRDAGPTVVKNGKAGSGQGVRGGGVGKKRKCEGVPRVSLRPSMRVQTSASTFPLPVAASTTSPSTTSTPSIPSSLLLLPSLHAPLPSLVLPPLAAATSRWEAPDRAPSILASPCSSPLPSPASHATLSPTSSTSTSRPSSPPLLPPLPPPSRHSFFLLPPLQRRDDDRRRLTLPRVLEFSHTLPGTCFNLQCLSLANSAHDSIVKAAQRLLKDAFHNDGTSSSHVYYLCITSSHTAVPVISASYFILQDTAAAAQLHLNTFLTRVEMRGLGFGALLLEAYREVAVRVALCRRWKEQSGGCELLVHSVADKIGWWQRMGCECLEKRVKVVGEGFDNTHPMRDMGRQRSDEELMAIVQRIRTFTPGAEEWRV